MRVVHINTMTRGGAARAMLRLHEGLLAAGVDSYALTQDGLGGPRDVPQGALRGKIAKRLAPLLDSLPLRLYSQRSSGEFNLQWVPDSIKRVIDVLRPDIVHLHWIGRGFMRIESLRRISRPIIWTMHDSWTFTGGCHVPYNCVRYREGCGCCPQLGSSLPYDLSWWVWRRKMKAWRDLDMTMVSPSPWLAECAASSPLLSRKDLRTIPNGLDLESFQPFDRLQTRRALGLPLGKTLILFGGVSPLTDRNKGFHLLKPAIEHASKKIDLSNIEMVVLGSSAPSNHVELGVPIRFMGVIHDVVCLRHIYAAADVLVLPSLFESFGQMASESLACGTPVVAFNATGLKDIVDHGQNGYLATPYDPADLGAGIAEVLARPDKDGLRQAARAKTVREYGLAMMVNRYNVLYGAVAAETRNFNKKAHRQEK